MNSRLVIKKFGPIKQIDLEIKKINLLIGDQGTGKSTVSKVLAICKDYLFLSESTDEEYLSYFRNFGIVDYFQEGSEIYFYSSKYDIIILKSEGNFLFKFMIHDKYLLHLLNEYNESLNEQKNDFTADYGNEKRADLLHLINKKINEDIHYIPAERNLIPIILTSSFSFFRNKIELPVYLSEFGSDYQIIVRDSDKVDIEIPFYDDVKYFIENNVEYVAVNNRKIKLIDSATGYINSIVLYLYVDTYSSEEKINTKDETTFFLIEEPELSLFPDTQKKIIDFFVYKHNQFNDGFLITTHSPYIISSLNNLMFAYEVARNNNEREVNKIIDRKYWLNPGHVSAYLLTQYGFAENIIADDGLIMTEKIDSISDVINESYDYILDVKYSKN